MVKKVSLRIRREYFDQIKDGTKDIEFRKLTSFWATRLYNPMPKEAVFICGKDVHRRKIKKIQVVTAIQMEVYFGRDLSEQGRKDLDMDEHHSANGIFLGEEVK